MALGIKVFPYPPTAKLNIVTLGAFVNYVFNHVINLLAAKFFFITVSVFLYVPNPTVGY